MTANYKRLFQTKSFHKRGKLLSNARIVMRTSNLELVIIEEAWLYMGLWVGILSQTQMSMALLDWTKLEGMYEVGGMSDCRQLCTM